MGTAEVAVDPDGIVHDRRRAGGGPARTARRRSRPATPVRVVEIEGLVLEVEPEAGGAEDYREKYRERKRRREEGQAGSGGSGDTGS